MSNKIFIICFCFIIGFEDETLLYNLKFMGIEAGESTLSIKKDTIAEAEVYHLTSITKTNSFLDRIYKIRDKINIILDANDLSIKKMEKKISEGGKKKFFKSIINYDSLLAISNNKTISIPGKILDPFGSIYYLRKKDINISDIFEFNTYDNDKIKQVTVVAKKIETISTDAGNYECIMIEPYNKGGKLLKNKGSMKIWLTNNIKKIPVKIENQTSAGKMIMTLKAIQ